MGSSTSAEQARCLVRRFGFDEESAHGSGVIVHVVTFVKVEAAGEVFDVHHVGQTLMGEAQDAEGASGGGVPTGVERNDLQPDVQHAGHFQQ